MTCLSLESSSDPIRHPQIPIYLAESSPPAYRSTFGGVAYQLGNMASSAAAQIEATAGQTLRTKSPDGKSIPDYAKVQGILIGVVIAWTLVFVLLGPENRGSHFEEARVAYEEGAGKEDAKLYVDEHGNEKRRDDPETGYDMEATGGDKGAMDHVEEVHRK